MTAFLSGLANAGFRVQSPAVVFDFRCGEVNGQHHFILRYGKVQRLFDGLGLNAQFFQRADHLIRIRSVSAESVPFGEQQQIRLVLLPAQQRHQAFPLGPVKVFGRVVLKHYIADLNVLGVAVIPKNCFLTSGRIALGLLIRTHADVQICNLHFIKFKV
ncbi:hypothetical protein DF947_17680 [Pedobacter paludis]|uniref:Uncharacterized protein n=1 Tax=Pedobacter paludis TaxID=2203212 RepID=A0A317EYG7_9SPHI|nr:hypothetical protein [Pedobacter paludis]PWS30266.1 hypothetical protein DF947_17680 [Pedobacter paludis]